MPTQHPIWTVGDPVRVSRIGRLRSEQTLANVIVLDPQTMS